MRFQLWSLDNGDVILRFYSGQYGAVPFTLLTFSKEGYIKRNRGVPRDAGFQLDEAGRIKRLGSDVPLVEEVEEQVRGGRA